MARAQLLQRKLQNTTLKDKFLEAVNPIERNSNLLRHSRKTGDSLPELVLHQQGRVSLNTQMLKEICKKISPKNSSQWDTKRSINLKGLRVSALTPNFNSKHVSTEGSIFVPKLTVRRRYLPSNKRGRSVCLQDSSFPIF